MSRYMTNPTTLKNLVKDFRIDNDGNNIQKRG